MAFELRSTIGIDLEWKGDSRMILANGLGDAAEAVFMLTMAPFLMGIFFAGIFAIDRASLPLAYLQVLIFVMFTVFIQPWVMINWGNQPSAEVIAAQQEYLAVVGVWLVSLGFVILSATATYIRSRRREPTSD